MESARLNTLARLQGEIGRIEGAFRAPDRARTPLGAEGADAALRGGLLRGVLHEVFAEGTGSASATGFVAALARRLMQGRETAKRTAAPFALWVRQDFSARENGDLAMAGLVEFGLDPRRLVVVRARDAEEVLQATADALTCNALAVVVAEIWGETRAFDLTASRKLTLAAGQSGVTVLALRLAALPKISTAETRWRLRPARSAAWTEGWGAPVLDVELLRNRHGPNGRWIMEWTSDACIFRDVFDHTPAHSQPVAAAASDRPYPPAAASGAVLRRAGGGRG